MCIVAFYLWGAAILAFTLTMLAMEGEWGAFATVLIIAGLLIPAHLIEEGVGRTQGGDE